MISSMKPDIDLTVKWGKSALEHYRLELQGEKIHAQLNELFNRSHQSAKIQSLPEKMGYAVFSPSKPGLNLDNGAPSKDDVRMEIALDLAGVKDIVLAAIKRKMVRQSILYIHPLPYFVSSKVLSSLNHHV